MSDRQDRMAAPRPLTFALLRLLADGDFHSGELLAKHLQVSRSSVNNALAGIDQYGLKLHSIRGRGYRLPQPPQWLDGQSIQQLLGESAGKFHVQVLDAATSSNTLLLQQATQGAPHGSVLAVEWQSGGRGRLGRTWHAGLGSALTFSVLWRFECGLAGLSGLSLAVGIALMRALKQLGIEGAGLKWPNDIVAEEGKLAGILIEAQGDMLGPSAVVIGIGINCALPAAVLQRIDQPVCDLAQLAGANVPDRNVLLAAILLHLAAVLGRFAQHGFACLREEWENLHVYQGKPVQLLLPDGRIEKGVAMGVTQDGALLVRSATSAEVKEYHAGEISLRGA